MTFTDFNKNSFNTTVNLNYMNISKEPNLKHLLLKLYKNDLVSYISAHQNLWPELIELAISDNHPYAWRASWLLGSCMTKNDKRVRKYAEVMIAVLPNREDSHQRELLKVLQRVKLPPTCVVRLFNSCTDIWENTNKKPSVRFHAFKTMVAISQKYPELRNELTLLTDDYYTNHFTSNVKKSILRMISPD